MYFSVKTYCRPSYAEKAGFIVLRQYMLEARFHSVENNFKEKIINLIGNGAEIPATKPCHPTVLCCKLQSECCAYYNPVQEQNFVA